MFSKMDKEYEKFEKHVDNLEIGVYDKPCKRCGKKEFYLSEKARLEETKKFLLENGKEFPSYSYRDVFVCGNCSLRVLIT